MHSLLRIVRWVAVAAALVCAVCAALVCAVLFTTPGARVAVAIVNARDLPVRIGEFDGRLAHTFRLRAVEFRTESADVHADTVDVTWSPLSLRHRHVAVDRVEVRGVRLQVGVGSAAPDTSVVSTAGPARTAKAWKIDVARFEVRDGAVDAPGDVRVRGISVTGSGGPDGYRADVSASGGAWRVREAVLRAHVSGNRGAATLDTLTVEAIDGVVRGSGFLRWDPALAWRASVAADSLRPAMVTDAPDDWVGEVSLRANATGSQGGDSTRVAVHLESLTGMLRGRVLRAHADVAMENDLIRASNAEVYWGRASARWSGTLSDAVAVTLNATVPSVDEILPRATGSLDVQGRVSGTPRALEGSLTVRTTGVRVDSFRVPDLDGVIDAAVSGPQDYAPERADIRRLDIRADDGRAHATGSVTWKRAVAWDLDVGTDHFETSLVTPPAWKLSGPVTLRARTSGRRAGGRVTGHADVTSLSGTVRDRDLRAHGVVDMTREGIDASNINIIWGDAEVRADGHLGEAFDMTAHLNAPDVSWLMPGVQGAVRLDGTVRGSRARPAVDVTVEADSVRFRAYRVDRIGGRVAVDLEAGAPANTHLRATGMDIDGTLVDSVHVDLTGTRADHAISLRASAPEMGIALDASGALSDSAWSGRVDSLRVRHRLVGSWHSERAAGVQVSRDGGAVDSLVLASDGARAVIRGTWARGDTARASVVLARYPLSGIQRFLPPGSRVTGTLDGSVQATRDARGAITGSAALTPGPGDITVLGTTLGYGGRVQARADSGGVSAAATFALLRDRDSVATIEAAVSVAGFVAGRDSLGDQPLTGHLHADCADVAPVVALVAPRCSKAGGTLTARLSARGAATDFHIAGTVDLDHGSLNLPDSGTPLRDVSLSLVSDGAGNLTLTGGATSGGGRLTFEAESARSREGRLANGAFSVTGDRFLLLDRADARVFVSPDVRVRVADRKAEVSGDVRVPFARIVIPELPASAVRPSGDVVFVEDTLATRAPIEATARVRVALGDSVTFRGLGLRARLAGSVLVVDRFNQPTMGTGEILLMDGKYRAYGNDLTIDPGRFVFGGGPIDNPGLDVRAYRNLDSQNVMTGSNEVVGVRLTGTLRRPEITLYSKPPLSDSEILSYLMFGRPLNTGSESDQTALTNAALLLGMYQGNQMAETFGKQFSLDEAYIESGTTAGEAQFVAGKYVSPRLFVSYVAGLFGATDYFRVRYTLSEHWTLQGESGSHTGSDILYTIERGR